jgi:hypothetical protein
MRRPALVALALLGATAAPGQPTPTPVPGLVVEEPSARFGEAYAGASLVHAFTLRNDGPRPVRVLEVAPAAADALPGPIPPGGRASVTVRQTAEGRLGVATYRFLLKADDGQPERRLSLFGFVQSAYDPDQPVLEGDLAPGGVARVVVGSREVDALEVLGIDDAPPFLAMDATERGPDGEVTLKATVAATAPLGVHTGTLHVRTNVPHQPRLPVIYRLNVFEDVAPEKAPVDLGILRRGQPFEKRAVLKSRAGRAFEVKSVTGAPAAFTVESAPCAEPAPSCRALVFKGTGPAEGGRVTGTVRVALGEGRELSLPYSGLTVGADTVVRDLGAIGDTAPGLAPSPAPALRITPPTPPPVPPPVQGKPGERKARLVWEAAQEDQAYGFLVYRSDRREGPFRRLNDTIVPVSTAPPPHQYTFEDTTVEDGRTYFYYLESISQAGQKARLSSVVTKVIPKAP